MRRNGAVADRNAGILGAVLPLKKRRGLTSLGCIGPAMSVLSLMDYSDFREDTVISQSILDSMTMMLIIGVGRTFPTSPQLTTGSAQGVHFSGLGLTLVLHCLCMVR